MRSESDRTLVTKIFLGILKLRIYKIFTKNIVFFSVYIYEVRINGNLCVHEVNTLPEDFLEQMFVLATKNNDHIASSTKIKNFKFKTEQDGETGWFVIDGTDCWASCDQQGGRCDHCGTNGFCCSRSKYNLNGDCTEKMLIAIRESIFSENDGHMCVAKLEEESCVDWTIQPNTDCPGSDMSETWNLDNGGTDAPEGPPKCIDLCLANRPRCVGWSFAYPSFSRPNRCFLKYKMENCRDNNGLESGTLMHYDCRENHNCGGSFVQIKDAVPGNMIGQETSFCGNKKPDEFYSLGNHVQIKIEFDSTTSSSAEFRAKYKGMVKPIQSSRICH